MASLQFSEGTDSPTPIYQNKQLLPNLVDGMARTRPHAIYAETPASPTTYDNGWRKITYSALANAINGVAWLLHDKLGRGTKHDTVAYIGPNDIAYVIMILGATKAGYKILSVSPRNTVADHISLLQATDCHTLVTPSAAPSPIIPSIVEKYSLRLIDSPSLNDLLDGVFPHYPYHKTFVEAKSEPLVVLHTSGTTGIPKPIIYTHDFATSYVSWTRLPPPPGFHSQIMMLQSSRLFVSSPFFHAGNLYASMFDAISNQTTIVTPLSGVAPSAEVVVEGLKRTHVDSILLVPPFLETIASRPDMVQDMTKNVDTVFYGGGSISQSAGDTLTSRTRLFNMNGSTETSVYPTICPSDRWPSEDWNYIHPHPDAGIQFRVVTAGSEICEAVITRRPDSDDQPPVFALFPNLTEYFTRDLFAPHPSKPGLWRHQGRSDDIIVFKPGYMCNPIMMQQHIAHHSEVRAALMTGTGRFQPALLIEPAGDQGLSNEANDELLERLWPLVLEANGLYKLGARISKTHVIILCQGQSMRYAGKGTVQRAPTLDLYKHVLDDLYAQKGDVAPGNDLALPPPNGGSKEAQR